MGTGTKQETKFLISNEPDTDFVARAVTSETWSVKKGQQINADAGKEIRSGHRRILVGHGTNRTFELARRRAKRVNWLWVGMPNAPRKANIYLYSCCCGIFLASDMTGSLVVGHFDEVPIPNSKSWIYLVKYFRRVVALIDKRPRVPSRKVFLDELRVLCSDLLSESYAASYDAWQDIFLLNLSLYP